MPSFTFAPLCTPDGPYSAQYAVSVVPGEQLPLFPMLMPDGWEHSPTQICRGLYTGTQLRGIPDIAVVCLAPTPNNGIPNLVWIRSERAQALGVPPVELERIAAFNLARRPASWKIIEPDAGARLAVCDDDYLAAERILDVGFMAAAADRLGAPGATLLVGIPARGMLIASVFTNGSPHDEAVLGLIQQTFAETRNKPICRLPFWVKDGRITAALEVE